MSVVRERNEMWVYYTVSSTVGRTKMRRAHCATLLNHFVVYIIFRLLWVTKNIGTKSHVLAVISVNIQEVPSVSLNWKMNYNVSWSRFLMIFFCPFSLQIQGYNCNISCRTSRYNNDYSIFPFGRHSVRMSAEIPGPHFRGVKRPGRWPLTSF